VKHPHARSETPARWQGTFVGGDMRGEGMLCTSGDGVLAKYKGQHCFLLSGM
jgi:hypothetical protein